jgi:hypothetical protein
MTRIASWFSPNTLQLLWSCCLITGHIDVTMAQTPSLPRSLSSSTSLQSPQRWQLILRPTANNGISPMMTPNGIKAHLAQPLSIQKIQQLQTNSSMQFDYVRATGSGSHIIRTPNTTTNDTTTAIERLRQHPDVLAVEPDYFMRHRAIAIKTTTQPIHSIMTPSFGIKARALPNDPYFTNNLLSYLQPVTSTNWGADFVNAWSISTGTGIVIGIVDTGAISHADIGQLNPNDANVATGGYAHSGYDFISDCRLRGSCPSNTADNATAVNPKAVAWDYGDFVTSSDQQYSIFNSTVCDIADSSWHGTGVASVMVARANTIGLIGAAYNSRVIPARALGKCGGYESDTQTAMRWLAGLPVTGLPLNPFPAKIINLSLGSDDAPQCTQSYQQAINEVRAQGAVVVVAAGNAALNVNQSLPANCQGVIVVGSATQTGQMASYSNYGSGVTLLARGGDGKKNSGDTIIVASNSSKTTPDQGTDAYGQAAGTSLATPLVSAAIALMQSINSRLTTDNMKQLLTQQATPLSGSCLRGTTQCGAGILHINNTLQAVLPTGGTVTIHDITQDASPQNTITTVGFTTTADSTTQLRTISINNANTANKTWQYNNFSITTTNGSAHGFDIVTNRCLDKAAYAPASSCTIDVRFTASTSNPINTAELSWDIIDNTSSQYIATSRLTLSGQSIVPTPTVNPPTLTPDPINTTSTDDKKGGGGCTLGNASNPDAALPLLLIALWGWQRRRKANRDADTQ